MEQTDKTLLNLAVFYACFTITYVLLRILIDKMKGARHYKPASIVAKSTPVHYADLYTRLQRLFAREPTPYLPAYPFDCDERFLSDDERIERGRQYAGWQPSDKLRQELVYMVHNQTPHLPWEPGRMRGFVYLNPDPRQQLNDALKSHLESYVALRRSERRQLTLSTTN